MQYRLDFLKGTDKYVLEELQSKHGDASVIKKSTDKIYFISNESLDRFSDMLSALSLAQEGGGILKTYKRTWRKAFIPAGINPSLAYVMCMAADLKDSDVILDPFCGGGTIPITASLYFPHKKVIASDISGKAMDITAINAKEAGIFDKMMLFRSDVKNLKIGKASIDKIITNMPFGIRVGKHEQNEVIYRYFASKLDSLLKNGGKAVVLTQEKRLIEDMISKYDQLKKIDEIEVDQGGLSPNIFVYKKV